jgi:antitoxin HigA-1
MARTPIHPGAHLAEELTELGISAAEVARQIDGPVNRVTAIINNQRAVTADTALRLGHWFGTSPEFWLNLQKLYELCLAREEVGDRVDRLPRLTNHKQKKRQMARLACSENVENARSPRVCGGPNPGDRSSRSTAAMMSFRERST